MLHRQIGVGGHKREGHRVERAIGFCVDPTGPVHDTGGVFQPVDEGMELAGARILIDVEEGVLDARVDAAIERGAKEIG